MTIDNENDLKELRAIGRIVYETMMLMRKHLKAGITTRELDHIGRKNLEKYGARSAPEVSYDFPGATCISINEEAAHGIPSDRRIQPGDLVNIDVSAELNGYFGDTGATFPVAPISPRLDYLCQCTRKALREAMKVARAGARLNQIGHAIEQVAKRSGFVTLKDLGSHGIGKSLHDEPHFIPNFLDRTDQRRLTEGQVITIEPFLSTGAEQTSTAEDGWTLLTGQGNYSAQYEYTMVITRDKPIVMTSV